MPAVVGMPLEESARSWVVDSCWYLQWGGVVKLRAHLPTTMPAVEILLADTSRDWVAGSRWHLQGVVVKRRSHY
jgi:hypothetical protein